MMTTERLWCKQSERGELSPGFKIKVMRIKMKRCMRVAVVEA